MIRDLQPQTVGELLERDLRVPAYQRPYRWRLDTAQTLLDDIRETWEAGREQDYTLGSVILCQSDDDGRYDIVDGQQRLLTLRMLLSLLVGNTSLVTDAASTEDPPQIVLTFRHLRAAVRREVPAKSRASLAAFIRDRCVLVQVVTDEEDEAFRFFDSQNYRGKPLKPHDLLKAHHLRALHGETDEFRRTIVEEWESFDDSELEHLFNRYLYRIARWSRGQRAGRELGNADIGLFKGIPADPTTPAQTYHVAAQRSDAAAPGAFAFLPSVRRLVDPVALRGRFQFDAPIIEGSEFFARISFLLEEQQALEQLLEHRNREFTDGRHLLVSELFLAAMLYWVNKFFDGPLKLPSGEVDVSVLDRPAFKRAWDRLFVWAYSLRLGLLRVGWPSVNIHALTGVNGDVSVFATLRDGLSGRGVSRLVVTLPDAPRSEADNHLAELLKRLDEGSA